MVLSLGTRGSGGFANAFSNVGFELFSLLPDVAAAQGLAIAARATDRANSEPVQIERKIARAARQAEREAKGFARIKSRLDTVFAIVERARTKLEEISLLLVDMRKNVELSLKADAQDDEKRAQANRFDQTMGLINIKVRNFGTPGNNLLGSQSRDVFDADTISFPIRPNSRQEDSITGLFAGSDFKITETSTGDVFVPDIFGARVQSLPINDDDVNDGILLLDDDTIVLDNESGVVSITRNGAGSAVLEGTLERHGLDVLFSSFYGNFLDDSSLTDALADVDKATQSARFLSSIFDSFVGRIGARRDHVANLIKENEKFTAQVESDNLRDTLIAQAKQQQSAELFARAFSATFSFQDNGLLSTAIRNQLDVQV
jgi:hypothetical protein